jgi:uncharacterized protein involved in response to NO
MPGTRGRRLQLLFGFWLLARLTLWVLPGQLWLAWLAEMLFLSLLIAELTRRIWAVRQWRNMWFPPLLLLLALLSSASYAAVENMEAAQRLHYGAIWIVTVLIVIIGGRVIPLFTGNRLGISISPLPAWLEWLAIASTVAIGVITALGAWHAAAGWARALCLGCGILHLLRLAHWRGWKTTRVPLLWSMHLAYLCIPLAMFGLALAGADPTAHKNIIHLLAVGSMGGMILAMMARVSLGHTGLPLEVPGYLAAAFGLVFLAAAIRAFLPLSGEAGLIHWAWRLSAGLWVLAFALFLVRYLPVLSRPRVDGKPG